MFLLALASCRDPSSARKEGPAAGSGSVSAVSPPPADAASDVAAVAPVRPVQAIPPPPDLAAPPTSATRTESGVASVVLVRGTGKRRPQPGDVITVDYTAWNAAGEVFDSSVQRGTPETLPFASAPRAWREAVAEMTVGERRRIWIPEAVAAQGRTTAPAGALVYEVTLRAISAPPEAPADLSGPPASAIHTASGLAYKILVAGRGKVHPDSTTMLVVHYTSWAADGTLVESTVPHGRPIERTLADMNPAFAEVLPSMVAGEKVRVWVSPSRAGSGDGGVSPGVFDVELVSLR